MSEDALFDLDHPPPIRKGAVGYLASFAGELYGGLGVWALAPVDQDLLRRHRLEHADWVDFVWLTDGRQLQWSLVDLEARTVIDRIGRSVTPDRPP